MPTTAHGAAQLPRPARKQPRNPWHTYTHGLAIPKPWCVCVCVDGDVDIKFAQYYLTDCVLSYQKNCAASRGPAVTRIKRVSLFIHFKVPRPLPTPTAMSQPSQPSSFCTPHLFLPACCQAACKRKLALASVCAIIACVERRARGRKVSGGSHLIHGRSQCLVKLTVPPTHHHATILGNCPRAWNVMAVGRKPG